MARISMSKKDLDMTVGSTIQLLIAFSIPLLIGNLFQQLYNTVDSVVVGQFVGKEALAAVGATTSIVNTLIGIFMGLSQGAMVVISQSYGARDEKKVHDAVENTMFLIFILSVVFTIVGVGMVPTMLRFMKTPADVFAEAKVYLQIYFGGVSGLMIYNMGSSILRAVGDSRRPLIFLIVSALTNIALDLVFVILFDMGVAGVAWATIIAQGISAVLVMYVLLRENNSYGFRWKDMHFNRNILAEIVRLGLPASLQMGITSFSNVFVQSYINFFDSSCMAAWSSYIKIDAFVMLPLTSLGTAVTTYVGQNVGAGKHARAHKGMWTTLALAVSCALVLMLPLVIFAPFLIRLFNGDPMVVEYGTLFLRILSPLYFLIAMNQTLAGGLRGAGYSTPPMIVMIGTFVFCRQIYLYVVSKLCNTIVMVALGYPMGWLLCTLGLLGYYRFGKWWKNRTDISTQQQNSSALS